MKAHIISVLAAAVVTLTGAGLALSSTGDPLMEAKMRRAIEFRSAEQELRSACTGWEIDADSAHSWDAAHYHIRMEFFPAAQRVEAVTIITGTCVEAELDSVPMHLKPGFTVTDVRADGIPYGYSWNGDDLTVALGRVCNPGDTFFISVSYNGRPPTSYFYGWALGIFWGNVIYSFTDPEGARNWFPCFDKPFDKATYSACYTVPEGWVMASNGALDSTVTNPNQTVSTYWNHEYPIETYLISVAASNYAQFSDSCGNIPLEYYVYPQHLGMAQSDFQMLPEMIRCYEARYGLYPFEKYGMAEAPIFGGGGAMEHQTMTTLGNGLITGYGGGEIVFCHELAHMWWGDALSLVDWPQMWLSEGFATFSEAVWVEWRYGSGMYRTYVRDAIQNPYMAWENPNNPHPLSNPPMNILFSPLTYEKGGAVLDMLRYTLGDSIFFASLRQYYSDFRYGNVHSDDFQSVCETVSGADLDWFFDQWVHDVGYPTFEYYYAYREVNPDEWEIIFGTYQTQDPPFPIFSTYIDIVIFEGGSWTDIETVWVDSVLEQFTYTYQGGEPTSIVLDPDNWVLGRKIYRSDITAPDFRLEDYQWSTGFLFPDSSADLSFTFMNAGLPAMNLSGSLYSDDLAVSVIQNLYLFGNVGYQTRFSNSSQPLSVSLASGSEPHWAHFHMDFDWTGGSATARFALPVGAPNLLLVDDDGDSAAEEGVRAVLDYLQLVYRDWDVRLSGLPGGMGDYEAVIWYCGHSGSTLSGDEISLLSSYLDSGGRLFISGTNIASELQGTGFLSDYLRLEFASQTSLALVNGVIGDPVGNGMSLLLSSVPPDQDAVNPTNGGIACFNYINNQPCGIRYEGNYRVVTLGFSFDDIRWDLPAMNKPYEVAASALNWLGMQVSGVERETEPCPPGEFRLIGAHPNPFNAETSVSFELPEISEVKLSVYNVQGKLVDKMDLGLMAPGLNEVRWDGEPLSSGIYFYRISGRGQSGRIFSAAGKALLLK